jgi:PAS domain S-box-containing protein
MMDFISLSDSKLQIPAYLSRPGGMSERIRHFNWPETSIGAVCNWKQSLRSALSICLNSNFPIAIYWGRDLCLLYNDAWSPIPGNKHPWALGRPAKEVWPEIWNDIQPQFAKAFSGEPGGSKDALLPMQRHGYTEECYFDFTFTPVYGEDGKVDGIFNAVIETTYQLINERRAGLLQKLSRKISAATSAEEVFKRVSFVLKNNSADIPFYFIYTLSSVNKPLLVAASSPETLVKELPIQDLIKNGSSKHLPDVQQYLDKIPVSFWPESPSEAMLVPLRANNGITTGFLFAGLSARRKFDREYQLFVEQVAGIISGALNSIHSMEEERNRAEAINISRKKLEESEKHFRSLTQALPQLVWVTDAAGKQEFVTERWKEYTGLDPYDTETWALMVHPDDNPVLAQAWNHSMQTGTTYKAEARLKGKDGKFRWFHVHGEPIRSEKKEIVKWVGAFTEIHEQKSAEELLRQSEEKLEFLVKKRTEQLERSNEDLQQFAHVASHDLKEPIRKIKIFSGLLQDEFNSEFNDNSKLYLSKIQSATDRMLLMMEGVLRYAALDGYQQGLDKIDLNEIIRSIETDLEMVIQKRKAVLQLDVLPEIQGYPVLIYQLFYNLISNALKFSRPDISPDIRINYKKIAIDDKDYAQFRIIDNGIGFEPEDAERIFQSFARLNAKEDYEGTGLGLSLCKKIVTRHQGFLTASGEPGLGAEFVVELPFIHEEI